MCCVEDELVGQLGRGGLRPDWANGFRIRFGFQKNHRARKDVETYESYFSRHHHSYRREKELARSPRCSTGTNACLQLSSRTACHVDVVPVMGVLDI